MAEGKKSNLAVRVASAAVLGPVVIAALYFGGWWFFALIALATVLMAVEWAQLVLPKAEQRHFIPYMLVSTVGPLLALKLAGFFMALQFMVVCVAVGFAWFMIRREEGPRWAAIGVLWLALPMLSILWMREGGDFGMVTVLLAMVCVWACDTGAYFVGKKVGGPKLAPTMSPNKTWSGLLGGMAAAALTAVIFGLLGDLGNLWKLALLGAVIAMVGQIGDLAESSVKRHFKVKDSGSIIPGHGGMLDRLDGILFAMPYVAAIAFLRGGELFPWP